jgi:hypothetical protein
VAPATTGGEFKKVVSFAQRDKEQRLSTERREIEQREQHLAAVEAWAMTIKDWDWDYIQAQVHTAGKYELGSVDYLTEGRDDRGFQDALCDIALACDMGVVQDGIFQARRYTVCHFDLIPDMRLASRGAPTLRVLAPCD